MSIFGATICGLVCFVLLGLLLCIVASYMINKRMFVYPGNKAKLEDNWYNQKP